MNTKTRITAFSVITTIFQGIIAVFSFLFVVLSVIGFVVLSGMLTESMGLMENVDSESVVAGWQVLFGIGGVFFGIVGLIIVVALLLQFGIPLVANIFFVVYGIRTYKNRNTGKYKKMVKNDSMYKLIFNGVGTAYLLGSSMTLMLENYDCSSSGDEVVAIILSILSIPFIISAALNISNLVSVKKLEDEPEQTDYSSQYVEQNFYGYENDVWNSYENQNNNSNSWR